MRTIEELQSVLDGAPRWAANPHQFGPGKIHIIDPDRTGQTICGKWLSAIPGNRTPAVATCKICSNGVINRVVAERERLKWQNESAMRAQLDHERNQEWWTRYNAYLNGPVWRAKRDAVMRRAGNLCEGCLNAKATEVHHLTYDHVFNEPLWDLRATCHTCHERVTELDRARRTTL